jgi:hypothetical protein
MDESQKYIIDSFATLFYLFPQLLSTIGQSRFMVEITQSSGIRKYLFYGIPCVFFVFLNLGYSWYVYAEAICVKGGEQSCEFTKYDNFVYGWWYTHNYWVLFMFLWNIIPPNFLAFRIVNMSSENTFIATATELVKNEKRYAFLNGMHLLVIVSYYITSHLQNTALLYDDYTYWSMEGNSKHKYNNTNHG